MFFREHLPHRIEGELRVRLLKPSGIPLVLRRVNRAGGINQCPARLHIFTHHRQYLPLQRHKRFLPFRVHAVLDIGLSAQHPESRAGKIRNQHIRRANRCLVQNSRILTLRRDIRKPASFYILINQRHFLFADVPRLHMTGTP